MFKPNLLISKCFNSNVRYDGGTIKDPFIEILKKYINFVDICPEIEIGLGVPRDKIIIVKYGDEKRLIQYQTGKDLTGKMKRFTEKFLENLYAIDGFILKSKSPSCGISSANYYINDKIAGKTDGFFAEEIKRRFPYLPIESEGRLKDKDIREHFLIRIFSFSEFRNIKKELTPSKLVEFHTRYKYLLLSYCQKNYKILGRLVAEKMDFKEKINEYEKIFYESFKRRPSNPKNYNTIIHIFGYFSDKLNEKEKEHFLSLAERYKKDEIKLNIIIEILRNFAYRFNNEYILNQKFLNPYPDELNI